MKHFPLYETRSAEPLETRDDTGDNAPDNLDAAIAAVNELRTAATALETRTAEQLAAMQARLDEAEVRAQRPGGQTTAEPSAEVRAFRDYLHYGDRSTELRALTVGDDPQGGYLAPDEISREMIRNLTLFSPIRSIASVRSTTSPAVKYPKRTSITNASWEGETEDQAESTVTFGQVEIPIRLVTTFVDLSNQLLADSAGQAEAEVNMALGEDFGKKEGAAFVNGTGVRDPEGFMVNADVDYVASGSASAITSDSLIDLMYALAPAYRGRGSWVMNGQTIAAVQKLKDGDGQYLWRPSIAAGQPETLMGRPIVEAVDMPDIAGGAFPIAFGSFADAYRIVDRVSLSLLVNPYLYATRGITRIHASRRVGGGVVKAEALRKLKISVS